MRVPPRCGRVRQEAAHRANDTSPIILTATAALIGMFTENGPFALQDDQGTMALNPYR